MLVKQIPAWFVETNAWVVADEPGGKAILIDAPPDPDPIGAYLAEIDVSLVGILLTHGHVDHSGGAGRLATLTGAATYAHEDDDFLTLHPREQIEGLLGMVPPGEYGVPETLKRLNNCERLDLAGISLEVRLTPGHTPGHCCLYWADEGILFSGDQLFAGSVGRTDFDYGSWDDLCDSMRTQVMTLEDDVQVLPGHGPSTTIGRERRTNPFRSEWQ